MFVITLPMKHKIDYTIEQINVSWLVTLTVFFTKIEYRPIMIFYSSLMMYSENINRFEIYNDQQPITKVLKYFLQVQYANAVT